MEKVLEKIKEVIMGSHNIVLVSGSGIMRETGLNGVQADHIAYEIEDEYGFSSEEIVSERYLSRQVERFYDYYRDIILNRENVELTEVYKAVAKLEHQGRIKAVLTRMVYGFYQKAGCKNVVELYGSAQENRCPVCGKIFDASYIKHSFGIPKCDNCSVTLRPGFTLYGEMLDNGKLTKACNAVEDADVLIVAGMALNSRTWASTLQYYEGNKLILLNSHESHGDEKANYRAYGNLSEIFKYITDFEDSTDDEKIVSIDSAKHKKKLFQ